MDITKIGQEMSLDQQKVNAGAKLDFGEFQLYVARWGNQKCQAVWRQIFNRPEVRRKNDLGTLTAEEDRALTNEVLSQAVLVGWSGIEKDGKPLPVSPENALKLLEAELLREAVLQFSKEVENYRAARIDAQADALKKS